jgi:hypothetical protein
LCRLDSPKSHIRYSRHIDLGRLKAIWGDSHRFPSIHGDH